MELFKYQTNQDDTISITGFSGKKLPTIEIPEQIDGKTVTEITDFAFQNPYDSKLKAIKEIQLPETIAKIGNFAFANNRIEALKLPENIAEIGKYAFTNNQIRTTNIPEKLTAIERGVFEKNNIETIYIPSNILTIKKEAFKRCKIKNLILSEGLIQIEVLAFHLNYLKVVVIPYSVQNIGDSAFANNTSEAVRLHASHNTETTINTRNTSERIKIVQKLQYTS